MNRTALWGFCRDDDGATATEYAVLIALILCAVIAAVTAVGNSTANIWTNNVNTIGTSLNNAGS